MANKRDVEILIHCTVKEMGYFRVRSTCTCNEERVLKCFPTIRNMILHVHIYMYVGLSTGIEKSLCYCVVPLLFDKLGMTQDCSIVVHTKLKTTDCFQGNVMLAGPQLFVHHNLS